MHGYESDQHQAHLEAARDMFNQFKQIGKYDLLLVIDGGTLVDVYHKDNISFI